MAKIENNKASAVAARRQASKQSIARGNASTKRKKEAGINYDPASIEIKKDASGKTTAKQWGKKFESPVSGSSIDAAKRRKKAALMRGGSGAIFPKSAEHPNGLVKKSWPAETHVAQKLADSRKARKKSGK